MQLKTTVEPIHFPTPDQDNVLHLGLQALEPAQWMQLDSDFSQFHRHKLDIKTRYPAKVYFALPGSEPAQAEFHQLLLQHLHADHTRYPATEDTLNIAGYVLSSKFQSLWQSALLVQEDICLLQPGEQGYRMTAASVCSPSNWKLEEKTGADLDFIHGPVPGYATVLSARVNRLFERLKTDAPLLRYNWSVQDSGELFWRADLQDAIPAQPQWHWRVERQTLRRLPRTRAVVFGIRIYLHDIARLKARRGFEQRLAAIARRLPREQVEYKGLHRWLGQRDPAN